MTEERVNVICVVIMGLVLVLLAVFLKPQYRPRTAAELPVAHDWVGKTIWITDSPSTVSGEVCFGGGNQAAPCLATPEGWVVAAPKKQ